MVESEETKFGKATWTVQQHKASWIDQHLQEFKDNYLQLNAGEKTTLRQIMSKVATIQGHLRKLPASFTLRFCVSNNIVDPESGEVVYHSYGQLGSNILLKAFDVWDNNKESTTPISDRRR